MSEAQSMCVQVCVCDCVCALECFSYEEQTIWDIIQI